MRYAVAGEDAVGNRANGSAGDTGGRKAVAVRNAEAHSASLDFTVGQRKISRA